MKEYSVNTTKILLVVDQWSISVALSVVVIVFPKFGGPRLKDNPLLFPTTLTWLDCCSSLCWSSSLNPLSASSDYTCTCMWFVVHILPVQKSILGIALISLP